jgi:Ca2+ transporting ATPase
VGGNGFTLMDGKKFREIIKLKTILKEEN